MRRKTVQYLFPDTSKAATFKVFQEESNKILGFYFSRDNLDLVKNQSNSKNYAVYFLFKDEDEMNSIPQIYVGQSTQGVDRISNHKTNKDFWSHAIMFVTDNNSFNRLTIDYLEYYFINKVKSSKGYNLNNIDERHKKPVISIFNEANLDSIIEQILFLLQCEGINLTDNDVSTTDLVYYQASRDFNAKLYVKGGKFYLRKGSELKRPPESTKQWKNKVHYNRYNKLIDDYIQNGKVTESKGQIVCDVDLEFKAPSKAADLVSGMAENGWQFFKGLDDLRK